MGEAGVYLRFGFDAALLEQIFVDEALVAERIQTADLEVRRG